MYKLITRNVLHPFYTSKRNYQVTVVGGASDIGQTLCLLLRSQPAISNLVIHDTRGQTPGVILDLSHVPSETKIQGYTGEDTLETALRDANIVIGVGGLIRKPGIPEHLWLSANTDFVRTLTMEVARMPRMPFLGIATEPINCLVPMAAEILRHHGDYDPKRLFGITGLDSLRAQSMYATLNNFSPHKCTVPVIGGHSEKTVIPLLSQSLPSIDFDEGLSLEFTTKFRRFDDDIMKVNRGFPPVLSVAYSALLFTRSILKALLGQSEKVNAFIENNDFGTAYFGGLVHINHTGVVEMERYTSLTKYELRLLEQSFQELRRDALKGKKVLELL